MKFQVILVLLIIINSEQFLAAAFNAIKVRRILEKDIAVAGHIINNYDANIRSQIRVELLSGKYLEHLIYDLSIERRLNFITGYIVDYDVNLKEKIKASFLSGSYGEAHLDLLEKFAEDDRKKLFALAISERLTEEACTRLINLLDWVTKSEDFNAVDIIKKLFIVSNLFSGYVQDLPD